MSKANFALHAWIAVAIASNLTFTSLAIAGWQSTRWNMTPQQVAEAMAGQAPLSSGRGGDRLGEKRVGNVGTAAFGSARFRTVYYYDANGLAQIALNRISGDCRNIYAAVVREHGVPIRTSNQAILQLFIWHDRAADNRIRLVVSQNLCDLNYERLADYQPIDQRLPSTR